MPNLNFQLLWTIPTLYKSLSPERRTIAIAFIINALVMFVLFQLCFPVFATYDIIVQSILSGVASVFSILCSYIPVLFIKRFYKRTLHKHLKANVLHFCLPFLIASLAIFAIRLAGDVNGLLALQVYAFTYIACYIVVALTYAPAFLYDMRKSKKVLGYRNRKSHNDHKPKRKDNKPKTKVRK